MDNSIVLLMAFCMVFIYQQSIFSYAPKLLVGGKISILTFCVIPIINCVLFYFFAVSSLAYTYLFLILIVVFAIEFKLISNASWVQSICGAAIFSMHIAAVNIPIITIVAFVNNMIPNDVIESYYHSSFILFITCFLLSALIQPLVAKIFNPLDIQRVTSAKKYSSFLMVSVLLTVFYEVMHIGTVFNNAINVAQLTIAFSTSFFIVGVFYFMFVYGMNLSNAAHYFNKSNEATSEKERLEEVSVKLQEKIERDALTRVYNRRYIMTLLNSLITPQKPNFSVLFVDINALKYTNDTYGHEAGDRLICKVADSLTDAVRAEDSIARIGGDEFLVIINSPSEDCALDVLKRIQENIDSQIDDEFTVSASIGNLYVDDHFKHQGVDQILFHADAAMRKHKLEYYK